jgi:hypothetical protein
MKIAMVVSLTLIGSFSLSSATQQPDREQAGPPFSIDQARYFATRDIAQAEYKQRMDEAINFPAVVPGAPKGLSDYMHGAEVLLAQLQRHSAYLYLLASRDIDDRADADDSDRADDAASHGADVARDVAASNHSLDSTLLSQERRRVGAMVVDERLARFGRRAHGR